MKKYILKALFRVIIIVSITACNEDKDPRPTSCITNLFGDKDGFGLGLTEGEDFTIQGGIMLPLDYRTPSDPRHTDIYPADMGTTPMPAREIAFEMKYDALPGGVSSATLTMFTMGIQDGDDQVVGLDTDYKLFINNEEVPEAFDEVDQFDLVNGLWSEIATTIEIELPEELLHELEDGEIIVRIEISGTDQSSDGFAIDYAELTVCPKSAARN